MRRKAWRGPSRSPESLMYDDDERPVLRRPLSFFALEDADVARRAERGLAGELAIHEAAAVVPVHEDRVMPAGRDGLRLDRPDLDGQPLGRAVRDHVADHR